MQSDALRDVAARFGGALTETSKVSTISVPPEKVVDACVAVSKLPGLYHLSTITGLDEGEKIVLHYQFWEGVRFVDVKTEVGKSSPKLGSLCAVLPSATLYEAEIQDILGVDFEGNPYRGKKLLLSDDYPAEAPPPLRKEADPAEIRRLMKLE